MVALFFYKFKKEGDFYFLDEIKNTSKSVIPVAILVVILNFFVGAERKLLINFFLWCAGVIIGLGIFLTGVEISVSEIGSMMGEFLASFDRIIKVILFGVFIGFTISIAEPDLLILAGEVTSTVGIPAQVIVMIISLGVGIMISSGLFRIFKDTSLSTMMCLIYGLADSKFLPLIGFVLGLLVVLAEPAVAVLSEQVEDVTGGSIPRKNILIALSIGVAFAVMLAIFRIRIEGFALWMLIVPGFLISLILSRRVDQIFVGIAFDSGGVASGPMTATFILAFCQGVAGNIADGFGVISFVAMMPVLTIMIMGNLYKGAR